MKKILLHYFDTTRAFLKKYVGGYSVNKLNLKALTQSIWQHLSLTRRFSSVYQFF